MPKVDVQEYLGERVKFGLNGEMVAVQKEHSFKIEEGGDDGVVPIEGEFAHIDRAMGDDFSVFEAY